MKRKAFLRFFLAFSLLGGGNASAENSSLNKMASRPQPAHVVTTEPLSLSSAFDEPLYIDEKIELSKQEIFEIPVEGLQNVLSVDPTIAAVRASQDNQKVTIQSLSYGSTYIHIWTSQGRKTLHINVYPFSPKKKEEAQVRKKKREEFLLDHSLSTKFDSFDNGQNDRPSSNQRFSYSQNAKIKTPIGRTYTNLRLDKREESTELAYLRTNLKNRAGLFNAGDINSKLSQITLPLTNIQGVEWSSPQSKILSAKLIGGYRNKKFWGKQSSLAIIQEERPIMGIKGALKPSRNLELFAAGAKGDQSKNWGIGGQWDINNMGLSMEVARAREGQAWNADLTYHVRSAYIVLNQRNIDTDYITASGSSWERGRNGQTARAGIYQLGFLSLLDVRYDQFRNSYLPSNVNPNALNREWKTKLDISRNDYKISQDIILRDWPGVSSPSQSNRYRTKISKSIGQVEPYVSYRKETEIHLGNSSIGDFSDTGFGFGAKLYPTKLLSFAVAAERVFSQRTDTGSETSHTDLSLGLRTKGLFLNPNLRYILTLDYEDRAQNFFSDRRALNASLRADYQAENDMNLFAVGRYERNMSPHRNKGFAVSVHTGIQWTNNMRLLWSESRRVKGIVFKDLNGDGLKQTEEPGVEGVKIYLNESRIKITDSKGRFKFKPAKGDLTVRLDTTGMPKYFRLRSSNPKIYREQEDDHRLYASFAIAYTGTVSGAVYIDTNENGNLDREDKPLRRVLMEIDNLSSNLTDQVGQFQFSGVAPGPHKLEVNVFTLPADMISITPTTLKIDLAEGEHKNAVFLVKPVRSITGKAFWDKNKNGRWEQGEPGVSGIVLFTENSRVQTNKNGNYYLNGFKAGEATINISKKSFKRKWRVTKKIFPKTFDIPKDRPFKRAINIPLQKIR